MAYVHKIIKIGEVFGVCLPQAFVRFYGIQRGHYCVSEVTQDGFLILKFFDPDKRPDLLEQVEEIIE